MAWRAEEDDDTVSFRSMGDVDAISGSMTRTSMSTGTCL